MDRANKHTTCRRCGGNTIIGERIKYGKRAAFDHIVYRCRSCGAWCGGTTVQREKPTT